uniref:TIR domain-containing protein n=1 Tax=Candidatus Kentrum sp. TC TaxID=2126339 RepID=A0A450ZK90_9GAMM|nr:MAG: TIR domain-containing protein [Candidatus Kentron sp. TC]
MPGTPGAGHVRDDRAEFRFLVWPGRDIAKRPGMIFIMPRLWAKLHRLREESGKSTKLRHTRNEASFTPVNPRAVPSTLRPFFLNIPVFLLLSLFSSASFGFVSALQDFLFTEHGEHRVALVIGNGDYDKGNSLKNPRNDAEDMVEALEKLDFQIIQHSRYTDLDKESMEKAIAAFGKALENHTVALFYYAGHGIQIGGKNYLIPVGTDIGLKNDRRFTEEELEKKFVDIDAVLGEMKANKTRLDIIILDACRNNPYRGIALAKLPEGLSEIKNLPEGAEGTLIAFSTAPGKTASDGDKRNSPYTKHLKEQITVKGREIEDAFKAVGNELRDDTDPIQISWYHSSLTGEFYFNPYFWQTPRGQILTIAAIALLITIFLILRHRICLSKKPYVFLSHSPEDDTNANALANALKANGVEVVRGADHWTERHSPRLFRKKSYCADTVLVLLSETSIRNKRVRRETVHALSRGCYRGVAIDAPDPTQEGMRLFPHDFTPIPDWKGAIDDEGIKRLVADLRRALAPRKHRDIETVAQAAPENRSVFLGKKPPGPKTPDWGKIEALLTNTVDRRPQMRVMLDSRERWNHWSLFLVRGIREDLANTFARHVMIRQGDDGYAPLDGDDLELRITELQPMKASGYRRALLDAIKGTSLEGLSDDDILSGWLETDWPVKVIYTGLKMEEMAGEVEEYVEAVRQIFDSCKELFRQTKDKRVFVIFGCLFETTGKATDHEFAFDDMDNVHILERPLDPIELVDIQLWIGGFPDNFKRHYQQARIENMLEKHFENKSLRYLYLQEPLRKALAATRQP